MSMLRHFHVSNEICHIDKNAFLVSVLEPVYDEYSQLETKYEIEKGCRTQAEEFATKVNSSIWY